MNRRAKLAGSSGPELGSQVGPSSGYAIRGIGSQPRRSYPPSMQDREEQLANLRELAAALREALATESSPVALARFYRLLSEVQHQIREITTSNHDAA